MTAAQDVVAWAWSLDLDRVPQAAVHAARRHLLDGLGCALAAARLGEAGFARMVASQLGGPPEASFVGGGQGPAPHAALVNGVLLHALDFDDTHADALVHATAAVAPAALAVAEQFRCSGRALLSAALAGYEIVTRLGAAVRHGFHARGFHATSVCGVFAAALVAAKLAGLDQDGATRALGIAGSFASGSLEFLADGSATKQLHPGWSGHAGILAARLAAEGATGPASILEGANGFYRAYAGADVPAARVTDGLGERWEVTRITIKPYPACQLSHAALDALAQVRDEIGDPAQVREILVEVPEDSVGVVCEPAAVKVAPRTPYEAKFSLPWCLAALLVDGTLTVATFAPEQLGRPELRDLAARVRYEPVDPGVAAAQAPGKLRVTLAGGRVVDSEVPVSAGGPGRPLSDDALRAKFLSNAGDSEAARALAGDLLRLDELADLTGVCAALRAETKEHV